MVQDFFTVGMYIFNNSPLPSAVYEISPPPGYKITSNSRSQIHMRSFKDRIKLPYFFFLIEEHVSQKTYHVRLISHWPELFLLLLPKPITSKRNCWFQHVLLIRDHLFVSPPNSYVETLNFSVMVFGTGAFGRS